jgi:peptide/nickel transport system substrate-binding protein
VRDQRLVVGKNPNYWRNAPNGDRLPYLDEVEFKPIIDGQSRLNALQANNVNVVHDDSQSRAATYRDLAQTGRYQYFEGGGEDEESFIMINVREEPLSDKRLRQALAFSTDRSVTETVTGEPPSLRADSPWNQDGRWYVDPGYPMFDQGRARQLVDAWKADHGGAAPSFVLGATSELETQQLAQVLQQQWNAVGFDVQVRTTEQVTYILDAVTANYQAKLWRQFSAPDPDGEYHWWIGENAAPKGQLGLNFARIQNAELDAALNEGRSNPDPEARRAAYAKVARIFADEVPYVWLHHVRWAIVSDQRLRDLLNGSLPDGQPSLPIQAGVHRLTHAWMASGS